MSLSELEQTRPDGGDGLKHMLIGPQVIAISTERLWTGQRHVNNSVLLSALSLFELCFMAVRFKDQRILLLLFEMPQQV